MDPVRPAYLLDTNTVSFLLRDNPPEVRKRARRVAESSTCISAVTEAELIYGLARKPGAVKGRVAVESYLASAIVLAWDSAAARTYGPLRAEQERKGRPLATEDMMIAAHALAYGLTLVAHDRVFSFVDGLRTEDWTVG